MPYVPPPLARKSSAPWDRLRPVKQDPLESMGYVSKGDNRLLDLKSQESFYNKIVARYMHFCSQHSKDLDSTFASLHLSGTTSISPEPARNQALGSLAPGEIRPLTPSPPRHVSSNRDATPTDSAPSSSTELSAILTGLRKLREGLLASSSNAPSPAFSQRVHVFTIRLSILAMHPPSYHPSLIHLLFVLHSKEHPLPKSELIEMTTYLILDMATRQNDLGNAYALRHNSRVHFGLNSRTVDTVLRSIVMKDWVSFWRLRRKVDGYVRAILHWQEDILRKSALKAIGRAYMSCDIRWILESTSGNELNWEELVAMEDVGWIRDGDKATIRKPKAKGS